MKEEDLKKLIYDTMKMSHLIGFMFSTILESRNDTSLTMAQRQKLQLLVDEVSPRIDEIFYKTEKQDG